MTVTGDDSVWPKGIAVTDVRVIEGLAGAGPVALTVSLPTPATTPVQIGYDTVAGTATEGSYRQRVHGTVTIPVGAMTATIAVPIIGDATVEPNDRFTFLLTSKRGTSWPLADPVGSITIINDDEPS